MQHNERIFVRTSMFEGYARFQDYFPGEIFPHQVELEEPDEDGHSLKRVALHEINPSDMTINETDQIEFSEEQLTFDF